MSLLAQSHGRNHTEQIVSCIQRPESVSRRLLHARHTCRDSVPSCLILAIFLPRTTSNREHRGRHRIHTFRSQLRCREIACSSA